jgi:dihydrofolate reductase
MRRIVNSTYVSLDGVIEHLEKWHFDYVDDDVHGLVWDQLSVSDALLMGRKSYEEHAGAWPEMTGKTADKINAMEKYVASTTMSRAEWNNTTVIEGDLVEQVTELKGKPGKDILMWGFGPVAATLLEHGLLDELCLWVHPVLAGVGEPGDLLLRPGTSSRMELVDNRIFGSGIVVLSYRPADASGGNEAR